MECGCRRKIVRQEQLMVFSYYCIQRFIGKFSRDNSSHFNDACCIFHFWLFSTLWTQAAWICTAPTKYTYPIENPFFYVAMASKISLTNTNWLYFTFSVIFSQASRVTEGNGAGEWVIRFLTVLSKNNRILRLKIRVSPRGTLDVTVIILANEQGKPRSKPGRDCCFAFRTNGKGRNPMGT